MRGLGISLGFVLALAVPSVGAQDPAAPVAALRDLERAARELAKRGRRDELVAVCEAMRELGHPADAVAELRTKLEPAAKAAPRAPSAKNAAAAIERALKACDGWFVGLPAVDRERMARVFVTLDGSHAGANALLGRRRVDGRWVDPLDTHYLARRTRIRQMLQDARRLELPFSAAESQHPILLAVTGRPGLQLTCGGLVFHCAQPAAKAERLCRTIVRASAVVRWLIEETLEPMESVGTFVLLDSRAHYARSLDLAAARGWIAPERLKDAREVSNWWATTGEEVLYGPTEAFLEASLLSDLCHIGPAIGTAQPCLELGIGLWVAFAFLGAPYPDFFFYETAEKGGGAGGHGGTASTPSALGGVERETMRRLAEAGVAGCKAWIAWLARRGEDPPWVNAFLDRIGKLQGNDRLKAMIVAEFLMERGPLGPLIEATKAAGGPPQQRAPVFEAALAEPLSVFEARWRRWLLPDLAEGVVQRCAASLAGELSAEDRATLEHLNAVRAVAFQGAMTPRAILPVVMEPELSDGCRLHGRYLVKHPEQAKAWPDAHEEYPDREGFTAAGCRAGGAAVIAPGSTGPTDAIDGWMGTFYHRLPLIDPGLVRIGWGNEAGFACLDCGSMVGSAGEGDVVVVWPAHKQRDVPRCFVAELPNPVPGESQDAWGYPVTLQCFNFRPETPAVVKAMRLRDSAADVDCWFLSPEKPYNPELAPAGAYCLIPKQPLRASTTYTVVAEFENGPTKGWSFTTGR